VAATALELAADNEIRARIVARLRALLDEAVAPPTDDGDVAARLESSTNDELFDFIDQNLGL
jgi:hypothetical protein